VHVVGEDALVVALGVVDAVGLLVRVVLGRGLNVPPLCERAQVDAVLVPAVREADPALGAVLEGGADDGAALDHAVVLRSMKGEQRVADKRSVREARAGSARAPRAAPAQRAIE
jgi:hypothetical protein